jgi:hypothetical protein
LKHGVETYGLNIKGKNNTISLISDTDYFSGLEKYFPGDILIINVVMYKDYPAIEHLNFAEAEHIIATNKPRVAILTHFGMGLVKAKPWQLAEKLSKKVGVTVLSASDGMTLDLDKYTD